MRLPSRLLNAIPLSTVMLLGSAGLVGCSGGPTSETAVVQAEVPAEAWRTISERTKTGQITGLTKVRDGGQTSYVAEWRKGNKDHEVEVYFDGVLKGVDTEITRPELPTAVGTAADLLTRTREAKVVRYFRDEVYSLGRLEKTYYEVKVTSARGEFEYEISETGELIESEGKDRDGKSVEPNFDTSIVWPPSQPSNP